MKIAKILKAGLLLSVIGVAACSTTDTIERSVVDPVTKNKKFDCGSIYIHRTSADIRAGTVVMNQAPRVPTAPMHRYSPEVQAYIRACNSNHTIYAGHTQPIVNVGIGINKQVGGGNTNVYGSQAYSGSSSGANAGSVANSN